MKTYFYRRANGVLVRIEAEQLFWSGSACIFVKNNATVAAIALLPGEIICEQGTGEETYESEQNRQKQKVQ